MNEQLEALRSPFVLAWLAFEIWMIVDAVRRRAPFYWYFVILLLPLGPLVYLLFYRLPAMSQEQGNSPESIRPSIPSVLPSLPFGNPAPNLERADKLEEADRYDEAEPLYRRALELDAKNKQALHGLGRCLLGRNQAKESLQYFERLLELERDYRGFSAGLDYADALWTAEQKNDALELLEHLADHSGRINHRLAFGHYLAEAGQLERAKTEVRRAVDEASRLPVADEPRIRQWVDRGRAMLEELEKTPSQPSSPLN